MLRLNFNAFNVLHLCGFFALVYLRSQIFLRKITFMKLVSPLFKLRAMYLSSFGGREEFNQVH